MEQTKIITNQSQWNTVAGELSTESIKLMSYDKTLLSLLKLSPGMNPGMKILDYGCGPGILAATLQRLGAAVKTYDISADMLQLCAQKIGEENIYANFELIPQIIFFYCL